MGRGRKVETDAPPQREGQTIIEIAGGQRRHCTAGQSADDPL